MSNRSKMTLFRPVGLKEMGLIYDREFKEFPPRRSDQPIFYPVLNIDYANQIARDWNTKSEVSGFAGFVTQFAIDSEYGSKYETHVVGSSQHEELWVPSNELVEFNRHIQYQLVITSVYFGENYVGPQPFIPVAVSAYEQFIYYHRALVSRPSDARLTLLANHQSVFLNFAYWQKTDFSDDNIDLAQKAATLKAIQEIWESSSPKSNLPTLE